MELRNLEVFIIRFFLEVGDIVFCDGRGLWVAVVILIISIVVVIVFEGGGKESLSV